MVCKLIAVLEPALGCCTLTVRCATKCSTHCKPATGRPNPTSAGCLSENDIQTIDVQSLFKVSRRLEFLFGANGQPGSMAIVNILMLLMKPSPAQGGSAISFPHTRHYQSWPGLPGSEQSGQNRRLPGCGNAPGACFHRERRKFRLKFRNPRPTEKEWNPPCPK